jgi:hypothetical protein
MSQKISKEREDKPTVNTKFCRLPKTMQTKAMFDGFEDAPRFGADSIKKLDCDSTFCNEDREPVAADKDSISIRGVLPTEFAKPIRISRVMEYYNK